MIRVADILPAGHFSQTPDDRVALDYDGRHRRRIVLTTPAGLSFLLDLPEAVQLRHGDGLKLDDGRLVVIDAEPEALMIVTAQDPAHLLRLAWHIGNRHLAAEVHADRLVIRADHVIGHMLEHLGAVVTPLSAPFQPEGGAYGGAHHHHD